MFTFFLTLVAIETTLTCAMGVEESPFVDARTIACFVVTAIVLTSDVTLFLAKSTESTIRAIFAVSYNRRNVDVYLSSNIAMTTAV